MATFENTLLSPPRPTKCRDECYAYPIDIMRIIMEYFLPALYDHNYVGIFPHELILQWYHSFVFRIQYTTIGLYNVQLVFTMNGVRHNTYYPSVVIWNNYFKRAEWYYDGKLHRDYRPAVEETTAYGCKYIYYRYGIMHRSPNDGPAFIYNDHIIRMVRKYMVDGMCHRNEEDGPAYSNIVIFTPPVYDSCDWRSVEFYLIGNLFHRTFGPSVIKRGFEGNGIMMYHDRGRLHHSEHAAFFGWDYDNNTIFAAWYSNGIRIKYASPDGEEDEDENPWHDQYLA